MSNRGLEGNIHGIEERLGIKMGDRGIVLYGIDSIEKNIRFKVNSSVLFLFYSMNLFRFF